MHAGIRTIAVTMFCASLLGCAGNANEGTVSGRITLDGEPLKVGTITLVPADGRTATAGGTVADGEYEVKAPIGDKRVQISAPKITGKHKVYEDLPDSPVVDTIVELLPPRYHSHTELTYTVSPGRQSKDFELTSK